MPKRRIAPHETPEQGVDLTQELRLLFPDLRLDGKEQHKKRLFLWHLSQHGKVGEASTQSGVGRTTTWCWRLTDAAFHAACERAKQYAVETLEDALIQRAVDGVETGIYWNGDRVATERRYSDTAAIFLLKGALPSKYKDRADVTHGPSEALQALLTQWQQLKDHPAAAPPPRQLPPQDYADAELVPLPPRRPAGQPSQEAIYDMLDRLNGIEEDEG